MTEKIIKSLQAELCLQAELIGAISAMYDIPLEEIRELKKRIKQDEKIEQMIKADQRKAAKKKFDKMLLRVV